MLKFMLLWREMQCDLHCRMPDFNMSTSHCLFYEMNIDLSACHMLFPAHVSSSNDLCKAQRPALGAQRLRQAEPTCYMDRHIDHRIFLGPSNSFLLLSCPYWFAPSLPRCVPVVLIKYKHYIPTEWSRWKRTKRKTKTSDIHCDKKTGHHRAESVLSTYLLQGHMKRPQHFPKSFKFFSASFMSWLIWFMPSSTRSSCSGQDKGMTVWNEILFCLKQNMIKDYVNGKCKVTSMHYGDRCIEAE